MALVVVMSVYISCNKCTALVWILIGGREYMYLGVGCTQVFFVAAQFYSATKSSVKISV